MSIAVSPREYAAFTSIFCRYSAKGRGCCQARARGSDYCGKHTRLVAKQQIGKEERADQYLEARRIWGGSEPITNIYIAKAGDSGAAKIGRAKDVTARLFNIQTDNHEEITLVATFPAPESVEERLHASLDEHRIRGEWFKWCPEIELLAALVAEGKIQNIRQFVMY